MSNSQFNLDLQSLIEKTDELTTLITQFKQAYPFDDSNSLQGINRWDGSSKELFEQFRTKYINLVNILYS